MRVYAHACYCPVIADAYRQFESCRKALCRNFYSRAHVLAARVLADINFIYYSKVFICFNSFCVEFFKIDRIGQSFHPGGVGGLELLRSDRFFSNLIYNAEQSRRDSADYKKLQRSY